MHGLAPATQPWVSALDEEGAQRSRPSQKTALLQSKSLEQVVGFGPGAGLVPQPTSRAWHANAHRKSAVAERRELLSPRFKGRIRRYTAISIPYRGSATPHALRE